MHTILLQIQDTLAVPVSLPQTETESSISLFDLALKGGWVMIPIALLSLVGVYIFIERFLTIRKADKSPEDFMRSIKDSVSRGEIQRAGELCKNTNTPFARMIGKGISRLGKPLADIDRSIENVAQLEIAKLESGFVVLSSVAGAAPMLGFLGTVLGLILAFHDIELVKGNVTTDVLARGIYVAMITTAAGLMVGIPAYFAYQYLVGKVEGIIYKMEKTAEEFFDLLHEPVK